jgi:hypothetical protein
MEITYCFEGAVSNGPFLFIMNFQAIIILAGQQHLAVF